MRKEGIHDLRCPTCNAEQQENFLAAIQYSEDARSVEETILELNAVRDELLSNLDKSASERSELSEQYGRLSTLLESRKGDMTFSQVIDSLGASNALTAFDAEESALEEKQADLAGRINVRRKEMSSFQDKKRTVAILKRFREIYSANLLGLNVTIEDKASVGIAARPSISGSGEPRAVLAYYAALWSACLGDGTPLTTRSMIPVVIDCPNQQGQDDRNLPAILKFIGQDLKISGQLLVTFEADIQQPFDQRINLEGERSLLRDDEFVAVNGALNPLMAKMAESLLGARTYQR